MTTYEIIKLTADELIRQDNRGIGETILRYLSIPQSRCNPDVIERIGMIYAEGGSITLGKIGKKWTVKKNKGASFRAYYYIDGGQIHSLCLHTGKSLEEMAHEYRHFEPAGQRLNAMTAEEIFETCKGHRIRKHAKKLTSSERIAYGIRMERN